MTDYCIGMTKTAQKIERPENGARPCLETMPYRMVVFSRWNGKTPLYCVGGSASKEMGAEKALRTAHKIHGGDCFYCKKPIKKGEATIDHAEPERLGGGKSIQNLIIACKPCNAAKGHKPIEAFNRDAGAEWLKALLAQVQDRLNRL